MHRKQPLERASAQPARGQTQARTGSTRPIVGLRESGQHVQRPERSCDRSCGHAACSTRRARGLLLRATAMPAQLRCLPEHAAHHCVSERRRVSQAASGPSHAVPLTQSTHVLFSGCLTSARRVRAFASFCALLCAGRDMVPGCVWGERGGGEARGSAVLLSVSPAHARARGAPWRVGGAHARGGAARPFPRAPPAAARRPRAVPAERSLGRAPAERPTVARAHDRRSGRAEAAAAHRRRRAAASRIPHPPPAAASLSLAPAPASPPRTAHAPREPHCLLPLRARVAAADARRASTLPLPPSRPSAQAPCS
jgi:hypothetical protein